MAKAALIAIAAASAQATAIAPPRTAQPGDKDFANSTGIHLRPVGGRMLLPSQVAPPRSSQCTGYSTPWYGESTSTCFGYSCSAANGAVTILSGSGCPCMTDNECWNAWRSNGGTSATLLPVCSGAGYDTQGTCVAGSARPYISYSVNQPIGFGCSSQYPCSTTGSTCDISYCGSSYCSSSVNGCSCVTNSQCTNTWVGSLYTPYCNSRGYCASATPTPGVLPSNFPFPSGSVALSAGAVAGIIAGAIFVVVIIPIIIAIACCGGIAAACAACCRANSTPVTAIDGPPTTTVITMNPSAAGGGYVTTSGGFTGGAPAYPNPYGQMGPMQQQQAGPMQQQMQQMQGMQQVQMAPMGQPMGQPMVQPMQGMPAPHAAYLGQPMAMAQPMMGQQMMGQPMQQAAGQFQGGYPGQAQGGGYPGGYGNPIAAYAMPPPPPPQAQPPQASAPKVI